MSLISKTKQSKIKSVYSGVSFVLGLVLVAVITLIIWLIEEQSGVTVLKNGEDIISSYLQLISVSFSVTFITTSLFGGLSDKSEKIYWLSYPENYLINTPLNFMVLSSLSFTCIGLQTLAAALVALPETLREALFFASFVVGIIAIVVLSYKFTAVFFTRKKLTVNAEKQFEMYINNESGKEDLQKAVVGLFNNTLEAAGIESNNFDRVSENVTLLVKYADNAVCNFWFRKLVVEIGRINAAMLSQLVSVFEETEYYEDFTRLLEMIVLNKDLPFDGDTVLSTIYDVRLKKIRSRLGSDTFFENGYVSGEKSALWTSVARELNLLLNNIDTRRWDNCVFVLENMVEIPYDLLKNEQCMSSVSTVWDNALEFFDKSVEERDAFSYRKLQNPLFDFLNRHPGTYVDDDTMFGCVFGDQLAMKLSEKTIGHIKKYSPESLIFMIDVIEKDADRNVFLLWLAHRLADDELPASLWTLSKEASYNYDGKYHYYRDMSNCIISELKGKISCLEEEYARRDAKGTADRYTCNLPLLEYIMYIEKFLPFLCSVESCEEEITGNKSIERFINMVTSRISHGEANSFVHESYDFYSEGDDMETTIINCYAVIFDLLLKHGISLEILRDILEITDGNGESVHNYYEDEADAAQKKKELLFFLSHVINALKTRDLNGQAREISVDIMARILANPCVVRINKESELNPAEVNEALEYIRSHDFALARVRAFISELNEDDSNLSMLYVNACNYSYIEPQYSEFLQKIAEEYNASVMGLSEGIEG